MNKGKKINKVKITDKKVSNNTLVPTLSTAQMPSSGIMSTPPAIIPPVSSEIDNEAKKIAEMLQHAALEYSSVKSKIVKERKRELETLDIQIKEFMGPFILLGYDLNNNPVEMVSASSNAEHDALLERVRRLMYRINQNIANSNGNDPYGLQSN